MRDGLKRYDDLKVGVGFFISIKLEGRGGGCWRGVSQSLDLLTDYNEKTVLIMSIAHRHCGYHYTGREYKHQSIEVAVVRVSCWVEWD